MTSKLRTQIDELYQNQADAIMAHNLPAVMKLHADEFKAIPLSGKLHTEDEWERDCLLDMKAVQYKVTTYEITKLSEASSKSVTVYVTRRCAGTTKKDKAEFNTEIRLRDILVNDGKSWKIQLSETISRELRLNGNKITIKEMPRAYALIQGCGDAGE